MPEPQAIEASIAAESEPQPGTVRTMRLLRIALLVFGGQILVLSALALLLAPDRSSSSVLAHTVDFDLFRDGARAWLAGRNPYEVVFAFVTPPLSLLLLTPFALLPMSIGMQLYALCNLVLVPLSLWWYTGVLRLPVKERVLTLVASLMFLSTLQSIFGGNLDSWMLVLLIAAFSLRRRLRGALFLAASVAIKLYSVIFLFVAVRRRQWKFLAFTLAAGLVLMLPFYALWPGAIHALLHRAGLSVAASISPATLVLILFGASFETARRFCLVFWVATFALALYRDRQRSLSPSTLGRYAPWMFGYPALVFPYVGVLATTVLPHLLAIARRRPLQWAERCVFLGFLLLGIHAEQVTDAMALTRPIYLYFRLHAPVIQSAGVMLMMGGASLSRCEESPEEAEA